MGFGRFLLRWTLLTAVALTVGSALGAAYALNFKEPLPAEAVAAEPAPEDAALVDLRGTRDVIAPPAPELTSPQDGAFASLRPRFAWQAVPDASNVIYTLEASADPGFPVEATITWRNIQSIEFRPDEPFPPLVKQWWRVRALDAGLNEGPWSAPWSFTPVVPLFDAEADVDVAPPS